MDHVPWCKSLSIAHSRPITCYIIQADDQIFQVEVDTTAYGNDLLQKVSVCVLNVPMDLYALVDMQKAGNI